MRPVDMWMGTSLQSEDTIRGHKFYQSQGAVGTGGDRGAIAPQILTGMVTPFESWSQIKQNILLLTFPHPLNFWTFLRCLLVGAQCAAQWQRRLPKWSNDLMES